MPWKIDDIFIPPVVIKPEIKPEVKPETQPRAVRDSSRTTERQFSESVVRARLNQQLDGKPTPHQALERIAQLPPPAEGDTAAIREFKAQRASIADEALRNAQPPRREDFQNSGLNGPTAEMEYNDALQSYNSQITELEGISAEAERYPDRILTASEARAEIENLPRPDRSDPAAIQAYNEQAADIADAALMYEAGKPTREDFESLPGRTADFEYRDALSSYNSTVTELREISADRYSSQPPTPVNDQEADEAANALLDSRGGASGISEDGSYDVGRELAALAEQDPESATLIMNKVQEKLNGSELGDNVADGFVANSSDETLRGLAYDSEGSEMLQGLQDRLLAGSVHDNETEDSRRLDAALASPRGLPAPAAPADFDEDLVEIIVSNIEYNNASSTSRGTDLANRLQDPSLSDADRNEVVRRLIQSDQLDVDMFTQFNDEAKPSNIVYDDQRTIATAIGNAYRDGAITDTDINRLIKDAGEENSRELAMVLATDPANGQDNGLLEAVGRQSEILGYRETADLAYSSSEDLIREHLPTSADQQRAFEAVRSQIDSLKEIVITGFNDEYQVGYDQSQPHSDRGLLTQMLGNAARLSANGNGYSEQELQDLAREVGPEIMNETISRMATVPGDDATGGALDLLGDVSRTIAGTTEGEEQEKWKVNQAIAHTQSPELIRDNFASDEEALAAFDVLNKALVGQRETADQGAHHGYTLLQQPALLESITTLFETKGDLILSEKLGSEPDYKGQADLVQLFQSTLFSTNTSPDVRARMETVINDFMETQSDSTGTNTGETGRNIGELLGTLQFAANRGVQQAGSGNGGKGEVETFWRGFIPRVMGVAAGIGVSAVATPVTGAIANELVKQVFTQVLDGNPSDPPSPGELEEAFVNKFNELGVDLNFGETGIDTINTVFDTMLPILNNELAAATDPQERADIQEAINLAEQFNGTLNDGFQNTIDSAQLDQELDARE